MLTDEYRTIDTELPKDKSTEKVDSCSLLQKFHRLSDSAGRANLQKPLRFLDKYTWTAPERLYSELRS